MVYDRDQRTDLQILHNKLDRSYGSCHGDAEGESAKSLQPAPLLAPTGNLPGSNVHFLWTETSSASASPRWQSLGQWDHQLMQTQARFDAGRNDME